jgi:hypothetical protein
MILLYNCQHSKFVISKSISLHLYLFIMYICYMFQTSWIIMRQNSLNVLLVLNCITNVDPISSHKYKLHYDSLFHYI